MSLKIFPYSLVRYAGLDHQLFDQLKIGDAENLLSSYQKLKDEKERLKNIFCDTLYPIINLQLDDRVRQQLINLKRQVFNDKKIDDSCVCLLPQKAQNDLQVYLNKIEELTLFKDEHTLKFEEEQHIHRKQIQKIAQRAELTNGLLLSSPLLYDQLRGFIKTDTDRFKQKEHRVMFSLLRYMSRMAFKTSPFSSFTYTGLATLSTAGKVSSIHEVGSRLKLNNAIFEYLKSILKRHPLLNEHLFIKLNITAAIKGDKICFLSNFNNIESFQQVNAMGLQLMVYRYLNKYQGPFSFKEMILNLNKRIKNPDHEGIKIYLIKLVEAGMLELNLGFSGMDEEWDHKLLLFLNSLKGVEPSVLPMITLFENLQKYRVEYQSAGSFVRYKILQEAESQLNYVFAELQQEARLPFYTSASDQKNVEERPETETFSNHQFVPYYFSARYIFYEDCFTRKKSALPERQLKYFVNKTNELLNHLLPLDLMQKERNKMRDFFLAHYKDNDAVDLTTFYKDYYFHVKKAENENESLQNTDILTLTRWKAAVVMKLSQDQGFDENLINLDNSFFADLPNDQDLRKNSAAGMFVQFSESEGSFAGVINAVLPGMGKVSGRFLSLFDRKITESFVQHNEKLYPDKIIVELNDASTFNANIHPPLLAHELELPGGNNIYPSEKQFSVCDLRVNCDNKKGVLRLYVGDSELYSYDLSLESFYNRSKLYQLLAHFNPDARLSLQPFIQLVDQFFQDQHPVPAPDLFVLPRIVYAGNVVMRRKTWRVKTAIIPQQDQAETDFEYFIKLNNWLFDNKIPDEVFLFLRKRAYQIKPDDKREGLHDDYKPQYVSFHTPLLLTMFKKLLLRAGSYITLEEVFPKPTRNKVIEYLIQWYNN